MKARLAKKICTTPFNKLSPWWDKALLHGDEKIMNALRMYNRKHRPTCK